jgi:hypothetical protein
MKQETYVDLVREGQARLINACAELYVLNMNEHQCGTASLRARKKLESLVLDIEDVIKEMVSNGLNTKINE